MANLGGFFSALVISLIVLNLNSVDAQFPESAYYTFGGYQSTMWDGGEDLQLVLTNNSGMFLYHNNYIAISISSTLIVHDRLINFILQDWCMASCDI